MTSLYFLRLNNVPIFEQLQLEEALLRVDDRDWCIVNKGSPSAIVMGISGNFQEHINLKIMETASIPVIRRFSGGGTVVVDESTCFYTLIGNRRLLDVDCFPDQLLKWTEKLYAPAFEGIDFSIKGNDYAIGEKKFGGNAQYISRKRWLHHSSLLWNFNEKHMDYLLMPKKVPEYRQGRSHIEFLCRLSDYFSDSGNFQDKMLEAISRRFKLLDVSLTSLGPILSKEHRRSTHLCI